MSPSDDSTRPISVAELLARNGTIGAPPVGGRRHRRRGNDQAVTVAELTGEIPIIRPETIPVQEVAEEPAEEPETSETVESSETVVIYSETVVDAGSDVVAEVEQEQAPEDEAPEDQAPEDQAPEDPPLSSPPWARRKRGPKLDHDPRPTRRGSDAEQMTYDPVDQSVDLAGLVDDQSDEAEELRSYLRSSGGTLFSGETVADDLARRGVTEVDELADVATPTATRPREDRLTALRQGMMAVLQSVLAVIFGAGLFIAFDQLWRWNNIVALMLSVLVILGLVIAVRVVRKTEDIASTLIAVAVGALVTLGPLVLLQST
ncbi:hypothetical protein [Mycolicibacterium sp.]|uniref:hypothetical protein n=1 Tax=Mycolicibacterium sp. TaxID=2320850 RepID=UPI001A27B67E|nr:hypothetical protein [Mycolicibacterium sp.]MBJ7400192.1 hypothetical protein [Mycolicibacterium sp.]